MKRLLLPSFALAFALSAAFAAYEPAQVWFVMQDPQIVESSGAAASSRSDEIVFTHNDSGDTPRFFALRTADGKTAATFGFGPLVRAAIDFEDMARGPGSDGNPALFIADIGDNQAGEDRAVRPFVTVYEVPEPAVDPDATGVTMANPPTAIRNLVYEDGPHNAETLMVDPSSGALVIVTKVISGVAGVYAGEPIGAPAQVLRRVGAIDFNALGSVGGVATGGDFSPTGDRFVVRTYDEAYEWTVGTGGLAAALATAPVLIDLPSLDGGEAIAYTRAGDSLFTTVEGARRPVHRIPSAVS